MIAVRSFKNTTTTLKNALSQNSHLKIEADSETTDLCTRPSRVLFLCILGEFLESPRAMMQLEA
jgi:hypothetical protein